MIASRFRSCAANTIKSRVSSHLTGVGSRTSRMNPVATRSSSARSRPPARQARIESSAVSKGGGTSPRWRGDGKELFYLAPNGTITSVAFASDRGGAIGPARALFQAAGADTAWAVTRDGERFLLAVPAGHATPSPFSVVFNWQAAVKR